MNLRPLDPQSPAARSPQFANDRILSATNNLDTGERSRTSAKSAVLLHGLLHDLATALREPGILDHVEKLRRAGGDSRHLFLHVDCASEAGLGIALALEASNYPGAAPYRLPAYEPPDDLTDLWVWQDSPGPGLHYVRDHGWRMVTDVPWE